MYSIALQAITKHFGSDYVAFLRSDHSLMDSTKRSLAPLDPDMVLGERCFITESIDNLQPETVRAGGRIAYLAFVGSTSWEQERKRISQKLPALR